MKAPSIAGNIWISFGYFQWQ